MPAREEVLNVLLAELLGESGHIAAPEEIVKNLDKPGISLPDVLVDFQGLRLAIEAKFSSEPKAQGLAYAKARSRVETGLAHIGVAVVYPAKLRQVSFQKLKESLSTATLEFAIYSEANAPAPQGELFPEREAPTFYRGNVSDLGEALRNCYGQLVRDETLSTAVNLLQEKIDRFLHAIFSQPATGERLAVALGIRAAMSGEAVEKLKPKERRAVGRISGLIIVNAMIFQEVLSRTDQRVHTLEYYRQDTDPVGKIRYHWQFILQKINYYPIFHTARSLLACLSADPDVQLSVQALLEAALWVVSRRASLRHDLAGRIYHRILAEAKYLGAFYTAIPSATLLLKLALPRNDAGIDWSDLEAIGQLRIADLACGTGTLLMAASDVVVDNYLRACVGKGGKPDVDALHRVLVEHSIYGFDVLPSAIHLTASTLALRVPDEPINVTNLSCLRLGGEQDDLGSLEFFENSKIAGTLFSQPERIAGRVSEIRTDVELPKLDLCVMNPPFTSSRQPNLLFGNLPAAERNRMQARLRTLVRNRKIPASITAGLAAVFIALGDQYLVEGGRLALVLPRAILSGVSWGPSRQRIALAYQLERIITCQAPGNWNFSENTNLSEALVVGRKLRPEEQTDDQPVTCVNLWAQPSNAIEALSAARTLTDGHAPDLGTGTGALNIMVGGKKLGESVSIRWGELKSIPWSLPFSFAQSELLRVVFHLLKGNLYIPGEGLIGTIPLIPLNQLGTLGPDPRDVYDGFSLAAGKTTYAALWGHNAAVVKSMKQQPNRYLDPHAQALPNRPLRRATDLWPRAGRVQITMRTRLNTKRMIAVRLSHKALADVWWPFVTSDGIVNQEQVEKLLVLWLNSTLGFLMLLAHRDETEGAWVQFKKPTLGAMPVLDLTRLDRPVLTMLTRVYDRLANDELQLLPRLNNDPTRAAIDAAFADNLDLPDLSELRELLSLEPILCQTIDRLLPPQI